MILINLSYPPWMQNWRKRNQAIFGELVAQGFFHQGIFVNPPRTAGSRSIGAWQLPKIRDLGQMADRVRVFDAVFQMPFVWRPAIGRVAARMVAKQLKKVIASSPYTLWINSIDPLVILLAEELAAGADRRIFDSSDDFVQFHDDKSAGQKNLERVLGIVDDVVCVNAHVASKMAHPSVHVFENGTDFANFQRSSADYSLPPLFPRPDGTQYVGFTGGLNRGRLDLDLLEKLFKAIPGCKFVFVGFCSDPSIQTFFERFPNAVFQPAVPYHDLPNVIRNFNVAMVPHKDNEHSRGNDLLKVMDYLACEVPVVSTRCSNIGKYGDAVRATTTHEEFIAAVKGFLAGEAHDPSRGLKIAAGRDWAGIVPKLAAELGFTRSQPDGVQGLAHSRSRL